MDDKEYVYVTAALTMQEFLLRVTWGTLTKSQSDAAVAAIGGNLRKQLMALNLPPGVEPSEEAFAIQRETLRQFDEFWGRVLAERRADTPAASR